MAEWNQPQGGSTPTLEDVLEKLVGTIHDEHRGPDEEIVRRDENSWLVRGSASVDDLLETIAHPELRSAIPKKVSRITGLLQAQLGHVISPRGDMELPSLSVRGPLHRNIRYRES